MNFQKQVQQAKFIGSNPGGLRFYEQVQKLNVNGLVKNRRYDDVLKHWVRTESMNQLQDEAYSNKQGYSIGYVNGKKVMFVSGSRNLTDWAFNALDNFIPDKYQIVSNHTSKNLTRIAKREKVDLVVGHSRGGALVAKMNIPNDKKLALDGAIRLAPKNRRNIMNLYQKQPLDTFITKKGSNRKSYKVKRWKRAHFISRDYAGYNP